MDTKHFCGRFRGSGTWRDSAGNSGNYEVVQMHRVDEDQYRIDQRHIHGGVPGDLAISLMPMAPNIYRVEAVDQTGTYGGYGFVINEVLQFHFDNHLGSITEIGYQVKGSDAIAVYGAATRNSAGNYIMWSEELQRVSDAEEIFNDRAP